MATDTFNNAQVLKSNLRIVSSKKSIALYFFSLLCYNDLVVAPVGVCQGFLVFNEKRIKNFL